VSNLQYDTHVLKRLNDQNTYTCMQRPRIGEWLNEIQAAVDWRICNWIKLQKTATPCQRGVYRWTHTCLHIVYQWTHLIIGRIHHSILSAQFLCLLIAPLNVCNKQFRCNWESFSAAYVSRKHCSTERLPRAAVNSWTPPSKQIYRTFNSIQKQEIVSPFVVWAIIIVPHKGAWSKG
jgi:hypothetical protein